MTMPKDYFEDMTPSASRAGRGSSAHASESPATRGNGDRSIRNIAPPRSRVRAVPPLSSRGGRAEWRLGASAGILGSFSRWWMWLIAVAALVVLLSVIIFAFRPTVVTVTPRSHQIVFDPSNRYNAYPALNAEAGALAYAIRTLEFEDSGTVAAEGTEHVEEKSRGTITVVNEYSTSPVRLIKNTRFQTPQGLVYRVPDSVVVPGKKGSNGGVISIEVYADAPGEEYNVGPVSKFTLPGLKSSPDMYAGVYARSDTPFSGGFIGERPRVAPAALEAARGEIRSRLEEKARGALIGESQGVALPGLLRVSYVSEPHTAEAGGGVRIHEKAVVVYPVFTPATFSAVIGSGVVADASGDTSLQFVPDTAFIAAADASALQTLETGPFSFSLNGRGTLIFNVDTETFAGALADREKSSFETIAASFPSIETARARVSPFWARSFPEDPADIKIVVEDVVAR